MQIFSNLLLRMYGNTLRLVRNQQADTVVDAKLVLDAYLSHGEWPEHFYIYYHDNGTCLHLPKKKSSRVNSIHHGYDAHPEGVLVKYTRQGDYYISQDVPISELLPEVSHVA